MFLAIVWTCIGLVITFVGLRRSYRKEKNGFWKFNFHDHKDSQFTRGLILVGLTIVVSTWYYYFNEWNATV